MMKLLVSMEEKNTANANIVELKKTDQLLKQAILLVNGKSTKKLLVSMKV